MQRLRELRGEPSPITASIPLQTSDYRALQQKDAEFEEDDEVSNAKDSQHSPQLRPVDTSTPRTRLSTLTSVTATPWVIHLLLLLINVFTFAYLLQKAPSDASCVKKLSSWSPAIDAGVIGYKTIPIGQKSSQYTGLSTAEVDAAWENITNAVPKIRISGTDLVKLDKKLPEGGVYKDDLGYAAQLEVYEMLDCLNRLRKANDRWQGKRSDERAPEEDETYTDHGALELCIDSLRVEIMCTSDADLVTYEEEDQHLRADFSGVKRCRGFDDILEWSLRVGKELQLSN